MKQFYCILMAIGFYCPAAFGQLFTNQIAGSGISATSPRLREIIDYDNDGFEDLILFNGTNTNPIRLLRNNHNFTFTNVTAAAGLPVNISNANVVATDFDNNGYCDLMIIQGDNTIRIFMNNAGVFAEQTATYGITNPVVATGGYINNPIPFDVDRDGDQDILFVKYTGTGSTHSFSILRNDLSNCTTARFNQFEDKVTGIDKRTSSIPQIIDYDNDQDADIVALISDNFTQGEDRRMQPIRLFRNDNGNFTDVTSGSGLTKTTTHGFATVWDYNNDGWLDLVAGVTDLDYDNVPLECRVFKNNGNGTFTNVTSTVVLTEYDRKYHFTATAVDFDNDADFDIYWLNHGFNFVSGPLLGNRLYQNNNGTYSENAAIYGLQLMSGVNGSGANQGASPSWFDADNDGDLDLFASSEVFPSYNSPGFFMRNNLDSSAKRFLQIRLNGCQSGKDPRGVRVEVQIPGKKLTQYSASRIGSSISLRAVEATTPSSHYFHFGLGNTAAVDSVIVYWPSGRVTRMGTTTSNQILTISEDITCVPAGSSLSVTITGDTSICSGQTVSLTASVSGAGSGLTYLWKPSTFLSDTTGVSVSASPDSAITYWVTARSSGCSGADSIYITVKPKTIAGYVTADPDTICSGNVSQLNVVGSNGTIQWQSSTDNISFADLPDDTISVYNTSTLSQTTYYRTKTTGNCGIDSSASVKLLVNPLPVAALSTSDTLICSGGSTQICTSNEFVSYLWNTGDTSFCTAAKFAGGYWLTVTDAHGCSAISERKNISVYPIPSVSIVVQGDTLSSFGAVSYQWYFNGQIIPGATSAIHIAQQTGNYALEITDANGCLARSNEFSVVRTGMVDLENSGFSVFPNPVNNHIFINAHSVESSFVRIELYDISGRLVFRAEKSVTSIMQLDASVLVRGSYLLKLKTTEREYWFPVLK